MKENKVRINVYVDRSTLEQIAMLGARLGVSKGEAIDWAFNEVKEVNNYAETEKRVCGLRDR